VRQSYWATQSAVTGPGPAGKAIDELPADLAALRQASSQLVFHYRAGGDFAENGVPAERVSEVDELRRQRRAAQASGREPGARALIQPGEDGDSGETAAYVRDKEF
jgi:hypothetical protein